jgi:hypothetical protein
MKLSIDVDTGIAAELQRIQRKQGLPNAEETIRYVLERLDELEDETYSG